MKRARAPKHHFFRKLRNMGLVLAATGGALLTAPVALPAVLVQLAGYLALIGGIASAIGQTVAEGPTKQ